jgi:hypothetical protein
MHVWLQPFAAIFVRQSVRARAPPLLPFGHTALKTGSAMPQPIASCLPDQEHRRKNSIPLSFDANLFATRETHYAPSLSGRRRRGSALLAAAGAPLRAYEYQQIFGQPLVGMEGRPRAVAPPRELVAYNGRYAPGTIVISTEERRL